MDRKLRQIRALLSLVLPGWPYEEIERLLESESDTFDAIVRQRLAELAVQAAILDFVTIVSMSPLLAGRDRLRTCLIRYATWRSGLIDAELRAPRSPLEGGGGATARFVRLMVRPGYMGNTFDRAHG